MQEARRHILSSMHFLARRVGHDQAFSEEMAFVQTVSQDGSPMVDKDNRQASWFLLLFTVM